MTNVVVARGKTSNTALMKLNVSSVLAKLKKDIAKVVGPGKTEKRAN